MRTIKLTQSASNEAMWAPHRRPAWPVNAPALARHICLRLAPDDNPTAAPDVEQHRQRLSALIKSVNEFLDRIQPANSTFRPRFAPLGTITFNPEKVERYDTLFFRIDAGHFVRIGVRVDIHNEYLAITFLADSFAETAPKDSLAGSVIAGLKQLQSGDLPTMAAAEQLASKLYDDFWTDAAVTLGLEPNGLQAEVFADFRGLALCPPYITHQIKTHATGGFQLSPAQMTDRRQDRRIDDDVYEFVEQRPVFFSDLLSINKSVHTAADTIEGNVVLSGLLSGAAIYGSTLRTRLPHANTPMRYFVVYNGFSENQLGRLIRRLHVLGELRIAALMDYSDVRRAQQVIRELEHRVNAVGQSSETRNVLDELDGLNQRYAEIGSLCVGGLSYRVTRSRTYAKAYRERLQDLRIVRIEGWQTYDEFMRRNLFLEFDYVSLVGERYDALGRRLAQFGSVTEIHRMERNTAALRELQSIAELVGIVAFVYYAGSVLAECALFVYEHAQKFLSAPGWSAIAKTDLDSLAHAACYALMIILYFPLKKLFLLLARRKM